MPEMRSPIERLLDTAEWVELPARAERSDPDVPYATHEGVLRIDDIELRCFQLDDGRRIFAADDIAALGGPRV